MIVIRILLKILMQVHALVSKKIMTNKTKIEKKNGNYSVIQHVTPIPYRRGLDLVIKYNNKERNKQL